MYFTNQNTDFDNLKIGSRLNDAVDVSQNDAFFFDPTQHSVTTKDDAGKETTTYTAPSMRLKLNSQFFMDKIINAPAGKLTSNEIFKEYFKGLYFKVEQSGTDPGSLAMINFAKGTITIKYKENTSSTDATRIERTIVSTCLETRLVCSNKAIQMQIMPMQPITLILCLEMKNYI